MYSAYVCGSILGIATFQVLVLECTKTMYSFLELMVEEMYGYYRLLHYFRKLFVVEERLVVDDEEDDTIFFF